MLAQPVRPANSYPPFPFFFVTFINGGFIATSAGRGFSRSSDGINWTAQQFPPDRWSGDDYISDIAFGDGLFLAVGSQRLASRDGDNWSSVRDSGPSYIAFGNEWFLTPAERTRDGLSWEAIQPNAGCRGIVFHNGTFYYHGTYFSQDPIYQFYYVFKQSQDGSVWTDAPIQPENRSPGNAQILNGLSLANEQVIAAFFPYAGGSEILAYPINRRSYLPNRTHRVVFGHNNYLAITDGPQGGMFRSQDLLTWNNVPSIWFRRFVSAAAYGETWVAVGNRGHGLTVATASVNIVVSTNGGRTVEPIQAPANSGALSAVRHGDGKFIAVGARGTVLRSFDGCAWTKRLSNTSSDLNDVVYAQNVWVAVGDEGRIVTSVDGAFFNLRSSGTEVDLKGITHGANQFVAVGRDGAIAKSSNGLDWTVQGTKEARDLWAIAYGNGKFVATGTNGIVHISSDTVTWKSATVSGADLLGRIAFAGGYFVAVDSSTRRLYISTDGSQWRSQTLGESALFGVDAANDSIWITGDNSEIWTARTALLIDPVVQPNGQFVLTVRSDIQGDYRIQRSTTLAPDSWQPAATIPLNGEATWSPTTQSPTAEFFRILPPE